MVVVKNGDDGGGLHGVTAVPVECWNCPWRGRRVLPEETVVLFVHTRRTFSTRCSWVFKGTLR